MNTGVSLKKHPEIQYYIFHRDSNRGRSVQKPSALPVSPVLFWCIGETYFERQYAHTKKRPLLFIHFISVIYHTLPKWIFFNKKNILRMYYDNAAIISWPYTALMSIHEPNVITVFTFVHIFVFASCNNNLRDIPCWCISLCMTDLLWIYQLCLDTAHYTEVKCNTSICPRQQINHRFKSLQATRCFFFLPRCTVVAGTELLPVKFSQSSLGQGRLTSAASDQRAATSIC